MVTEDNLRYFTIEKNGETVYDSRTDVPCDMEKWAETRAKFEKHPPITIVHHGAADADVAR
ncbi:hypothetical protein AKJ09_08982 [Labilithrix luteola]|uniref:Uncharacterized protein n=1 Tax=Labilithrix luteola TaxID=1391654 RepID=A0A0K1Q9A9_9BACT|nr:hypothetical protein [Labilithrix luteola]AKV02319.1 hypothetical protein AKJ09_08982 [Labilithrix luteola]